MAEIKAEQVPDAVSRALGQELGFIQHRNAYCKAIAAAINAWPGMVRNYSWDGSHGRIIIPLTEKTDDNV